MCLAAFAFDFSERISARPATRFPLVIASNRDEFHDRPTAALDVWTPAGAAVPILAGRDLLAGGTWFGLTATGRLALLTNVRDPLRLRPDAPSRGALVTDWLTGDETADAWWPPIRGAGHNGFNLIAADLARGSCHWLHSDEAAAQPLGAGLYGLSNGRLDEPWPKVRALKQALNDALRGALAVAEDTPDAASAADTLAASLFAALADDRLAPDAELPATGVPLALERQLSAVHIRTPDGRYGTRCSTVLIVQADDAADPEPGGRWTTTLIERNHGADGQPGPTRRARWADWPGGRPLPIVETLDRFGG